MPKRILIGAFDVPGYGGAATVAYRLFEDLQQQGLDVAFLNIIAQNDAAYLRLVFGETLGNPRGLANVHCLVLERAPFYPSAAHANLSRLIESLAPDVLLGVDFIATLLLKTSAPQRRIIYRTAGCQQAQLDLLAGHAHSVCDILAQIQVRQAAKQFRLPPRQTAVREAEAVACADLILVHAEMMRALYGYYYPAHADKLFAETVWLAEWICADAAPFQAMRKPFAERSIDLLFIASQWDRPEKNWPLARALILRLPELNIHVVGEIDRREGRATYHGLVTDRAALFALMGEARVVVSPSRLDAAPGILFEAAAMGCNLVASRNCGNWEVCHPALLAEVLTVEAFSRCIRAGLAHEYHSDLERFWQPSARRTLREVLQLF